MTPNDLTACGGCGAPLAADQRYCLNCGRRHGEARVDYARLLGAVAPAAGSAAAGSAVAEPAPAAAPGPRALSPLAAAAGVGLLLLAVLVGAIAGSSAEDAPAPAPVVVAGTTPATVPAATFSSDWSGEDGWTVQLQVLPKAGTTPQQVADAKTAATAAGATAVGALDSDAFGSLDPGNYVVYSGVYSDRKAAKAALKELADAFPDATVIEVAAAPAGDAATEDEAGGAAPADEALKELETASPEEYVKKSRKLPNELGTGGDAPPVDEQAPGGGSDEVLEIE